MPVSSSPFDVTVGSRTQNDEAKNEAHKTLIAAHDRVPIVP